MRTSISRANRYMLLSFVIVNLGLVVFMAKYAPESKIGWLLLLITTVNVGILLIYTVVNSRYWSEYDKVFSYFSSFIREKRRPDTFPLEEEFDENARFLSLFKRTYVEHNLLKKDYDDFKKVFDKFIPKEIHAELGFRGYERIVLGTAERKSLTIMFLDIMRFTAVQESINNPYRSLLLLNIYFDGIGEIIYKHQGYIEKYLGDGMLAIFDERNTDAALLAAIEIQEFIKKFQISTIGRYIEIGIGINTGEVIIGTVGTKRRMDATVIGDVVNTASRLQSMTRESDHNILISGATKGSLLHPEWFAIDAVGEKLLRGKKATTTIYGIQQIRKIDIPQ